MFSKSVFSAFILIYNLASALKLQPYWRDPRIHTLGNNNWFHALIAPAFTKYLDHCVYEGNLRVSALEHFVKPILDQPSRFLDVGCGVGMSTIAINEVWSNTNITGIDTSFEMISCARLFNSRKNIKYSFDNIHYFNTTEKFHLSTVMYMLHETPQNARIDLMRKLDSLSNLTVIIDISQNYEPSKQMLWGEPYLLDYQHNIYYDIKTVFSYTKNYTLIPNHVQMWIASNQQL